MKSDLLAADSAPFAHPYKQRAFQGVDVPPSQIPPTGCTSRKALLTSQNLALCRLAGRFLGVAVMKLDVEGSMASKLFSYEKVLTRGESRRRGAKPVVKNNQSFPCFTLHQPCNLVPS